MLEALWKGPWHTTAAQGPCRWEFMSALEVGTWVRAYHFKGNSRPGHVGPYEDY